MIVLAEDDPDQRLALRLALEQAGYRVREAADGRQALALLRERASPVLITDIFMPDADGFELIASLRREFPATKIVVISGGGRRAKQDYVASAQLMGVDASLRKPVRVDELLDTLKRLSA
jgi:two-component system sensor histidine kinase EvgS